jgi:hypothetical protein
MDVDDAKSTACRFDHGTYVDAAFTTHEKVGGALAETISIERLAVLY